MPLKIFEQNRLSGFWKTWMLIFERCVVQLLLYWPEVDEVDLGEVVVSIYGVLWAAAHFPVAPVEVERVEIVFVTKLSPRHTDAVEVVLLIRDLENDRVPVVSQFPIHN